MTIEDGEKEFTYATGLKKLILILVFTLMTCGFGLGVSLIKMISKEVSSVQIYTMQSFGFFLSGVLGMIVNNFDLSPLTKEDYFGLIVYVGIF